MKTTTHQPTDNDSQRKKLMQKLHNGILTEADLNSLACLILGDHWYQQRIYQSFESNLVNCGFSEPIKYHLMGKNDFLLKNGGHRRPSLIKQTNATLVYAPEKRTRDGEICLLYLLSKISSCSSPPMTVNCKKCLQICNTEKDASISIGDSLYHNLCVLHKYIIDHLRI